MTEICQRCKEEGEDRRTLWMACFYEMNELQIPFEKESIREGGIRDDHPNDIHNFYTLRVCKDCRSDWMTAIQDWFKSQPNHKGCGSGIYVRVNGANREVSEYEFRMMYPGVEPTRVISND